MIRRLDHPLARRAAAVLLLLFAVWLVAPILSAPLDSWRERAAAIDLQRELLARQARNEARRTALLAAAAGTDPPVFVAADGAAALAALEARVRRAAPAEAFALRSIENLPGDDRPGAPLRVALAFQATSGGLYSFLADLETKPPILRVDRLEVVATDPNAADGPVVDGVAELSAVPLLGAIP